VQSSPELFIHWQEFHWLTSLTGPSHGLGAGVLRKAWSRYPRKAVPLRADATVSSTLKHSRLRFPCRRHAIITQKLDKGLSL